MALEKLIPVGRSLITRNVLNKNTRLATYVTYGPPRERISFFEKVVWGVALACGSLAIPAWVVYHIPEYQGQR